MKNILRTAAVSLFVCGALLAQRGPGARAAGGGTPPDPATRIAHQVERLTTMLDLTASQASQITTILTNAESATTSARTTLDTDQTALQAAIKTNAVSTIDQLSSAIGVLQGQLLSAHSKAEAAVFATLNTTQQAKVDTLGGMGLLGGPGRGPGGRGMGGPGGPPRP